MRRIRCLVIALLLAAGLAPAAHAQALVGIGETHASVFADPRFQALGITTVRTVIPYDTVVNGGAPLAAADAYMAAAQAAGQQVLLAFDHSTATTAAPSLRVYRR